MNNNTEKWFAWQQPKEDVKYNQLFTVIYILALHVHVLQEIFQEIFPICFSFPQSASDLQTNFVRILSQIRQDSAP
jgi:hypothetical protein